jgi:hypothetical protein
MKILLVKNKIKVEVDDDIKKAFTYLRERTPIDYDIDYFDTNFDIAADWELMLRIINANNFNIKYINEKIANFRLGGKSYTLNKASVREKHNIRRKYYGKLRFDFYYYFDLIKLLLPERLVIRINKTKNRLIN